MTVLSNTLSLGLLNQIVTGVEVARTATLLNQAAHFLSERAGFEDEAECLRQAAQTQDTFVQQGALLAYVGHRKDVAAALIPHVPELARTALMEARLLDCFAVVRGPRRNPVPWWFDARHPRRAPSGETLPARIPLNRGTLALGGLNGLDWLKAIRSVIARQGQATAGLDLEPYLLWMPDERHEAEILNTLGGVFRPGKGFERVNEAASEDEGIRIEALPPVLGPRDWFIIDTRNVLRDETIVRHHWDPDDSRKHETVRLMFERKYQTVRDVREIHETASGTMIVLADGTERALKPHEALKRHEGYPPSELALEMFQHWVPGVPSDRFTAILGFEALARAVSPIVSYDENNMPPGSTLLFGVWAALQGRADARGVWRGRNGEVVVLSFAGDRPLPEAEGLPEEDLGFLAAVSEELLRVTP